MIFKVGEVVELKSGGADMTVSFVGEKTFPCGEKVPIITCTWFYENKLNKESFSPDIIKLKVEK